MGKRRTRRRTLQSRNPGLHICLQSTDVYPFAFIWISSQISTSSLQYRLGTDDIVCRVMVKSNSELHETLKEQLALPRGFAPYVFERLMGFIESSRIEEFDSAMKVWVVGVH